MQVYRYMILAILLVSGNNGYSQSARNVEGITIRTAPAGGAVYMLECQGGFGGGNVAASVGPDGILLVDNMFAEMKDTLLAALRRKSAGPVRIVINSHSHADHIAGNAWLSGKAVIVAQENLLQRFRKNVQSWVTAAAYPQVTFADSLRIHFNGEDICLIHLPNGHTDNDVFVYFPKSGVIHLGDTFFNGMFPAVYTDSGGNILQMIVNLEWVLHMLPDSVKVIPGHGPLATKAELVKYVTMLKETTSAVLEGIQQGKTLQQLQDEKILAAYDELGQGGAQTTIQYLAMLYKLLGGR